MKEYLASLNSEFRVLKDEEKIIFIHDSVIRAKNILNLSSKNSITYYIIFKWYSKYFEEDILRSAESNFLIKDTHTDVKKGLRLKQFIEDYVEL